MLGGAIDPNILIVATVAAVGNDDDGDGDADEDFRLLLLPTLLPTVDTELICWVCC